MQMLQVRPQIHQFNHVQEFAEFFNIGAGDFILTHEFLYTPYLRELHRAADFLFQEKYGVGEPSDEMINAIIQTMGGKEYKRIIAIGGGTVIDIAKLLTIKDAKHALDLFEKKIPLIKSRELILVPTTCGTGSEVTNVSIAEIKSKHTKMGLAVDELYANHAVLIPELVRGLPYKFFVTSSIDALIHGVESFVSPKSNAFTELFSLKAIETIIKGYQQIIERGPDYRLNILSDFAFGSTWAGVAFANTGVGAVHALSYPLGGNYHVPHGEANYQFFIEVFKTYNHKQPDGKIRELNEFLGKILAVDDISCVYDKLAELLEQLLNRKPLREYGMKEEEIETFTDNVISGQQRLLVNNYVPLSRNEIHHIFHALY
jgi:4-hydroxybutyrate dehydrogenase